MNEKYIVARSFYRFDYDYDFFIVFSILDCDTRKYHYVTGNSMSSNYY